MQNNYDLNNVVIIYLAGSSKHNFMFFFCFWTHKQRNFLFFLLIANTYWGLDLKLIYRALQPDYAI